MLKDKTNARKYLSLSKTLARNKMPYILTTINIACLIAIDDPFAAKSILNSVERDVVTHPVDSVRKKYFHNRLLIESMENVSNGYEYYNSNKEQIDKYVSEEIIEYYINNIFNNKKSIVYESDTWDKLYKTSGLVYWYVDPLKLI